MILTGRRMDRSGDLACYRIDAQPSRQAACAVGQRITVHIVEIRGDIEHGDAVRIRVALVGNGVHRNRRIVDRVHGDDQIGGIGAALAIADRIAHRRHRAVPVRRGSEGVCAIAAERESADARDDNRVVAGGLSDAIHGEADHIQGVHVRVGIVAQHVAADGHVLVGDGAVVNGGRGRILHHPVEGLRDAPAMAVRCCNDDRVGAVRVAGGAGLAGAGVDRAADDARLRIQRQPFRQALGGVG